MKNLNFAIIGSKNSKSTTKLKLKIKGANKFYGRGTKDEDKENKLGRGGITGAPTCQSCTQLKRSNYASNVGITTTDTMKTTANNGMTTADGNM